MAFMYRTTFSMNFMDVYGAVVLVAIPIIVTSKQNSILIVPSKNCMKPLNRNIVFCASTVTTFKSYGYVIGIVKPKEMKISNRSSHPMRWYNLLIREMLFWGGRTDAARLHHHGEQIKYVDVTSLSMGKQDTTVSHWSSHHHHQPGEPRHPCVLW